MQGESRKEFYISQLVHILCAIISATAIVFAAWVGTGKIYEAEKARTLIISYPEQSYDPRTIDQSYQRIPYSDEMLPTQFPVSENTPYTLSTQQINDNNTPDLYEINKFQEPDCRTDWVTCWEVDDSAQTITWKGLQDSRADIGQAGEPLYNIRMGYKAILSVTEQMTLNICQGQVNGVRVVGPCPVIQVIEPGTYEVISPGASGGFRVYK